MSGMGQRERTLVAFVGVIALYALAVGCWFFHSEKAWKKASKDYAKACKTYREERSMIERKAEYKEQYEAAKSSMPMFEAGKATDTTWQRKLDAIAERNLIVISQKQVGKEIDAGDVTELEIEVKSWEGCLEALVKFLHEIENTEEGMFDVKALNFKPSSKRGYLKGSLTLTCAYMREKK